MTSFDVITAIKDVLVAVAAVTTTIVAGVGLKNWQRELRGKAHFETAQKLVRATYSLRNGIASCRSPMIWAGEFPAGWQHGKRTAEEAANDEAHVYKNRMAPVFRALDELDAQALEGEALWGAEVNAKCEALRKCVSTLNAAIESHIRNTQQDGEDFKSDPAFGKVVRSALAASPSDQKNKLSIEIAEAIKGIESLVARHLRR